MPTYEYRCPEGHDFEKFVLKISSAASELPCPTCGLLAPRRMSAGSGFLFKGSGFYITDYGKDGKKDQRAAATAAAAKSSDAPTGAGVKAEGAKSESSKSESATAPSSSSKNETPVVKADSTKTKPASPTTPPKSGPAK
jgi:putative FmdB family regulatory protein